MFQFVKTNCILESIERENVEKGNTSPLTSDTHYTDLGQQRILDKRKNVLGPQERLFKTK